jgi:hypothetical protein
MKILIVTLLTTCVLYSANALFFKTAAMITQLPNKNKIKIFNKIFLFLMKYVLLSTNYSHFVMIRNIDSCRLTLNSLSLFTITRRGNQVGTGKY